MWHEARFAAQAIHHRSTKIAALLLLQTLACGVVCCLSSQPAAYYTLASCSATVTTVGNESQQEDLSASFCANISSVMRDTLGPPSGAADFSSEAAVLAYDTIKLTSWIVAPAAPVASTATVLGVTTKDSVEQTAHANAWGICIDQSFTADAAGGSLVDAHANATERGCTSWTELCASRRAAGARECARDDGLCACDCASVGGVVAAAMDAGTALVGVALVLVLLRGAASLDGSESRHGRVAALVALVASLAAFGAGFGEFYAACYVGGVRHAAWGGGEIRFGSHHTAPLPAYAHPQTLALGPAAIACAAALVGGSLALAFLAAAPLPKRADDLLAAQGRRRRSSQGLEVGTVRGPDSSELPTISNDPRASRPSGKY